MKDGGNGVHSHFYFLSETIHFFFPCVAGHFMQCVVAVRSNTPSDAAQDSIEG